MRDSGPSPAPADVVIAGGGVAALEALMALHERAGARVRTTLVAPQPDFVDRAMSVATPFDATVRARFPLDAIARDFGAEYVRGAVTAVDPAECRVELRTGETLPYAKLILATGARPSPVLGGALLFTGPPSAAAMRDLVREVERGAVHRVAFVAPVSAGWALPLYELALLTARHTAAANPAAEFFLITPESRPLEVFGPGPSSVVIDLLAAAGVTLVPDTLAEDRADGSLRLVPGPRELTVDRVVTLPLIRGPGLAGVPADDFSFIPVDSYGRVVGLEGVYAAGDAANFPVKQGGLAAQQADVVAGHIAASLGAPFAPVPFHPVLRGKMFTGGPEHYLRDDGSEAGTRPLWWPPTKVAGRLLAPYLYAREHGAEPGPGPAGFTDLEVDLDRAPAPA